MKKTLLSIALALGATASFAQTVLSPNELCMNISRVNSSNGNICAQLISRNFYDPASISLANKVLAQGSANAIEVLKVTANRRMEPAAGQVCEQIAMVNSTNAVACASAVLDARPAPELLRIASRVLSQGSAHAVGVLNAGANAFIFAPLADVCEGMASINGSNTVICVQTIANKVSMNGSEQICRTALSNGSSYALECLRGIVMDYVPVPQPTAVMVELYKLDDLKRSILKARAQVNRGMIENALRSLDEAAQSIDLIINSQEPALR